MKIFIGSDHAGYFLKEHLKELLAGEGYKVRDLGTDSDQPVDYPDIAGTVAWAVRESEDGLGILVCGTGIGMAIAANKIPGIRAAVCQTTWAAKMARLHNNCNVLTVGARVLDNETAWEIVKVFLSTPFEGGRHSRRVDKITALESKFNR